MTDVVALNSESFDRATDAFRGQCTVALLVQLSEENVATQPAPPYCAFLVPETSIVAALAQAILESFRRHLPEPSNAPLFWLSRKAGDREPVSWTTPVGLLAQTAVYEAAAVAASEQQDAKLTVAPPPPQVFPIKLFANFRVSKRADIFPFHATSLNGARFVECLHDWVLHTLKRSVAIMTGGSEPFRAFIGALNPQDMQRLKEFCLMDSLSVSVRAEFSQFHKNILGTINVVGWPVMIHSYESGRTLTLSLPAQVPVFAAHPRVVEGSDTAGVRQMSIGGIQSSAARQPQPQRQATAATAATTRGATFMDLVEVLATKMSPAHLPHSEGGIATQERLRQRLRVGGLPSPPLGETPLRWIMERLVGADLALHVLMLPPARV